MVSAFLNCVGHYFFRRLNPKSFMRISTRFSSWAGFFVGAVLVSSHAEEAATVAEKQFAPGTVVGTEVLPEGRFRNQLEALPADAKQRAIRWLNGVHFTSADTASLHAHANGSVCFACRFAGQRKGENTAPRPSIPIAQEASNTVPVSPFPDELKFNSRPTSTNIVWLNFEGANIKASAWNDDVGRDVIRALPFSADDDYETYSEYEQSVIKEVWQRVAEDFAPFDVNVTTQRPPVIKNRTATCIITRNTDADNNPNPASDAGGVAFLNVFGGDDFPLRFSPAWVYHNNLQDRADYISDAASHEIGHNLGLTHDGRTSSEYYWGHGSGPTSWAPIMGAGYDRNVTQWSKGEYFNATNTKQDDLEIIVEKLGYRGDDHGSASRSATPIVVTDGNKIASTNSETDPSNTKTENKGIIERNTDVDVFSFESGAGEIDITASTLQVFSEAVGGNLDLKLDLYDESGLLVAQNDPLLDTSANIKATVPQGTYYLHIKSAATGDPMASDPTGYTKYGSLGQYFLSGSIVNVPRPPTLLTLGLNNGDTTTDNAVVTLNHTTSGGTALEYRASETADLSDATWLPYESLPKVTLSGFGKKTIYMQTRNDLGESDILSDAIQYYDATSPPVLESMAINEGASSTENADVTLTYQWLGGLPSEYRVSENVDFSGATWQPYVEKPSFRLTQYGMRTVYLQLKSDLGTSAVIGESIQYLTPANMGVFYQGKSVSPGYGTPDTSSGTDFGSVIYGQTRSERTFSITNTGQRSLNLQGVTVPVGFILTQKLPAVIEPGGSASFTVQLVNTLLGTNRGQVVIVNDTTDQPSFSFTVTGFVDMTEPMKNPTPVAHSAQVSGREDQSVPVLLSATEPNERPLTYRIVDAPTKGRLEGVPPALVYKPDKDKNGRDSFTFVVSNGSLISTPAKVVIDLEPVNDPPVARNAEVRMNQNTRKTFRLKATDVDSPVSNLRYKVIGKQTPNIGKLVWNSKGEVEYTPAKNFTGTVKFKYEVRDEERVSRTKTVTVVVRR
jgi:hypothetical protein